MGDFISIKFFFQYENFISFAKNLHEKKNLTKIRRELLAKGGRSAEGLKGI